MNKNDHPTKAQYEITDYQKKGGIKLFPGEAQKRPHIRTEIQMALGFSGTNNSKLEQQCLQNARGKLFAIWNT